jgi:small-conductance mechanosensitive channel
MNVNLLKIIETVVVIVLYIIAILLTKRWIKKLLKKINFSLQRRRLTIKMINLMFLIISSVFIAAIWGVNQSDMVVFVSSVMAILGIAFVAQWSILSNITAGVILFFNHPLKIGDYVKLLEKDFVIEGTVDDITYFFVHIETSEKEKITISNSLILQKIISIVPSKEINQKKG